ncbi:MAG TPA: response regulator transcription factor [Bacillota bacterium]|nr:response regulator transcription factor [Bacillota bacterium]
MSGTIAIIEDESNIVELVKYNLDREGYHTISANNGKKGLELVRQELPDLVILDLMMPEMDGITVCKQLRSDSQTKNIPIIILTAKSEEADRVLGLEMGADDYVTKPFSPRELVARVRAVLRRSGNVGEEEVEIIEIGDIKMDLRQHLARVRNEEVELTPKEFDFLKLLLLNPGRAFTREFLLEHLWGYEYFGDTRTVDVHVRRLRQKIETDPADPIYLETVRGVGYRFRGE